MEYLVKNAKDIPNAHPVLGDVFNADSLKNTAENSMDMIVSNPPYIRSSEIPLLQKEVSFEPKEALDGGESGLDFYVCIAEEWKRFLKPGGLLLLEIGEDQAEDISVLLQHNDYSNICILNDIYGNPRIACAEK